MYKYCTKTCKICTQDQVGDYVAYPDWLLLAAEDLGMTSSAPTTTTAGTTTVQRGNE